MKPKKVVFYLLTCLVLLAFSSISSAAIPVKVSIDKGTIITLKEPAKRVSLANPNIADLNLISPYEILLNGKTLGSTNLIVWDTKGKATFFDVIAPLKSRSAKLFPVLM
jgi:pilus assembly protein CpaC